MATSPTWARDHDPFVYGDLKKWLDGLRADIERLGGQSEEAWDKIDHDLSVVTSWVRRVDPRSRRGTDVAKALIKEGYIDLWVRLIDIHHGVG